MNTTTLITAGLLAIAAIAAPPAVPVRSEPVPVVVQPPVETRAEQIERLILETFPDAPIMLEIAYCESGAQTPTDCHGPINERAKNPTSSASGVFQITKATWEGCAGDIFKAEDNIACARKIYDKRGTQPWDASRHAWGYNEQSP